MCEDKDNCLTELEYAEEKEETELYTVAVVKYGVDKCLTESEYVEETELCIVLALKTIVVK